MCEQIMSEKHQILVAMLDGMDRKVSSIGEQMASLESRVKTLEENDHHQIHTARGIYQAANKRQNDLEAELRKCTSIISENTRKCDIIEQLSARIAQLESVNTSHPEIQTQSRPNGQNLSIAVYGLRLREQDNVIAAVDTLFTYMGLNQVKCKSAFRTASKPEVDRPPVVIAELCCIEDKQAILQRKRCLRTMPMYHTVFIQNTRRTGDGRQFQCGTK